MKAYYTLPIPFNHSYATFITSRRIIPWMAAGLWIFLQSKDNNKIIAEEKCAYIIL